MWEYIETVEISKDMAGKWRARILCRNGAEEECFFLKFQAYPALDDIDAVAAEFVEQKNTPPTSQPE